PHLHTFPTRRSSDLHISQIANRHIGTPDEVLDVDQKIEAKVLSVSEEEERISLSIKEVAADTEEEEAVASYEQEEETSGFSISEDRKSTRLNSSHVS